MNEKSGTVELYGYTISVEDFIDVLGQLIDETDNEIIEPRTLYVAD
ncbi:MAG: hypothetical protein AAGA44_10120 [Pseudomonadota bacterium]